MTKDDKEKIKKIERIEKIFENGSEKVLEKEYAKLVEGLSNEAKKEKLKYIIVWRDVKYILSLNIVDELMASLDTDEDKLELINIAANDGKSKQYGMFNKTILSLSTDKTKIEVIEKDWSVYYSTNDLISSLSTDELKIKIMEEKGYHSRIIASLNSDKLKIELMEQKKEKIERDMRVKGGQWAEIIASLSSDELKLEQIDKFHISPSGLGEIIASLSSDELKLEQIDKFHISPSGLGKIIASLSSDELKLEQLDKLQDKLYSYSRLEGVSEGFSKVIKSLSDDEIKLQAFQKYKKNIYSVEEIILSLSTDEAKIKAIDETGYIDEKIIASLCDDKNKIELMKKHIKKLYLSSLGNIIKGIESDEEKIKQLQMLEELKQEITKQNQRGCDYFGPEKDIIISLSTDEARLKCIELGMKYSKLAFLCLETDEAKQKVLELLNDEKYTKNIIRNLGNYNSEKKDIIREIILSLNTNEKIIETLLMVQDDIDESIVRKIVAELDYYDDSHKESININISSGTRITSNYKTLNVPIEKIMNSEDAEYFHDCYFKYFNSEIANKQQIFQSTDEEIRDFLKFAKTLGCFSKDRVLDEDGRETEVFLGQKASSLLAQLLKTEALRYGQYHGLFDSMQMNVEPNQEFLKFISQAEGKNKEKRFINLELLVEMEKTYPGLFAQVMSNFDEVKELREGLDKDGIPKIIPWEEALKRFYLRKEYEGVTKDNRDIAEVLATKGVGQEVFDEAVLLREKAKEDGVPEHILGKPIKEETILESIERIREQTESKLKEGMEILEGLYSKKFTYEWLSKNDPTNSIMGLFVDCCGTITSSYYGSDIARASITAHDVQNLVIRDYEGKIISKGTVYVNKEKGYAVINDFELNRKYREHETTPGRYAVNENDKEEQEREQIFQAYLRGIQAFIEEYNKQNPKKVLKQINIGTTYNRLKRQIERFNKATMNLSVPAEYNFRDAEDEQYILYQRPDTEKLEIKYDGGKEL